LDRPAMKVTEAHALRMLRISGIEPGRAQALIRELTFPAELDDVVVVFARVGITKDSVIDRMGGSP